MFCERSGTFPFDPSEVSVNSPQMVAIFVVIYATWFAYGAVMLTFGWTTVPAENWVAPPLLRTAAISVAVPFVMMLVAFAFRLFPDADSRNGTDS